METAKKLEGSDRINYFCVLLAAIPFNLFFLISLKTTGLSLTSLMHFFINVIIVTFMFKFIKMLYKETNNIKIIKKILIYQILPVIIIFFAFVQGKAVAFYQLINS